MQNPQSIKTLTMHTYEDHRILGFRSTLDLETQRKLIEKLVSNLYQVK